MCSHWWCDKLGYSFLRVGDMFPKPVLFGTTTNEWSSSSFVFSMEILHIAYLDSLHDVGELWTNLPHSSFYVRRYGTLWTKTDRRYCAPFLEPTPCLLRLISASDALLMKIFRYLHELIINYHFLVTARVFADNKRISSSSCLSHFEFSV